MNKEQKLKAIWRKVHKDYKGISPDGTKGIMILRDGVTMSVPLNSLTDKEIERLL